MSELKILYFYFSIIDHNLNLLNTKWNGYSLYCWLSTNRWLILSMRFYAESKVLSTIIQEREKKNELVGKNFNNKAVGWKIPIMLHRNDNVTIEIIFHIFQYATGRQIWSTLYILFISFTLHSDFVCTINIFRICIRSGTHTPSNTNWPYSMINSVKWTKKKMKSIPESMFRIVEPFLS